jgi:hypothetical protein
MEVEIIEVGVIFIVGHCYHLTRESSRPLEFDVSIGTKFYMLQITPHGQRSNSGVLKLPK